MDIVLIVIALIPILVLVVLGLAATRPKTFRVQRAMTIDAPAERIAPLIADFRRWADWSPYEKLDPALKRDYAGAESGKGAVYGWEGNQKAGAGRMEILEASPSKISIKLDFLRPMVAHNMADFLLEPDGTGTRVTWAMHGPNLWLGRIVGLFFNLDRMIGRDFETGLANLKRAVEG
jgi:hypothetical protein